MKKLKQIEEKKRTKSRSGEKGIKGSRSFAIMYFIPKQGEFHSETKQIETEMNDR